MMILMLDCFHFGLLWGVDAYSSTHHSYQIIEVRGSVSKPRPTQHEIVRFGPRVRSRTSQEVTNPSIVPAEHT